jgi:hypothetical protein
VPEAGGGRPFGSGAGGQVTPDPALPVVVSPAFSSVGWSFRVWLSKNLLTLKILAGFASGYVASLNTWITAPTLNALFVGSIALGSKFGLDWLDYYVSERVEVPVPTVPKPGSGA